jgi:hypothetical protein
MFRITKLNWQEPTAYVSAIVAIGLGIYVGIKYDPAWLSRAGSVVIVCGVLLAASRKIELLHAKASEYIANHRATKFDALLAEHQNADGSPITHEQGEKLRKEIYGEVQQEISSVIEDRRRVFKLHEVAIVIAGTIINGFGEWSLKVVIHAI